MCSKLLLGGFITMKPNAPSLKRNFHDIKEIIGKKKDNSRFMTGYR